MNYFPFHLGDYAAHTGHLEPMEDLAYRRLLDLYYLREGPLPADIQVTAKLVRMRSMAGDVEAVLSEFFVLTDEGWTHTRCDEEIEKMQDKQAKARKSAQASVNARRANVERSLQEQSTDVQRSLDKSVTDVELPTPTPTPTPVLKNTFSPDLLPESKPDVPTGFLIPLNDGTEYPISERDLTEWEKAYLAVNVKQELREIRTWSLANKTKRKTKNGVLRFIVAWLAKAQDTPSHSRNFSNGGGASGAAWEGAQ